MNTRYRRNKWARINMFWDELMHKWDYHGKYIAGGVAGGFALGVLAGVQVAMIVWGI